MRSDAPGPRLRRVSTELTRAGPAVSRARWLTITWLVTSVGSVLLLPLVGIQRESATTPRLVALAGLAGLLGSQLLVLWSAVTPWASASVHRRAQLLFVAAAAASVPMVAPAGGGEWATWAWVGASIVGVAPLVWRWPTALLAAVVSTVVSVVTGLVFDASWAEHLLVTAGCGAGLAAVNWAPVWLWELLVRAHLARDSQARFVAAEERNRFGQDVHDILGHDLTVIALKSELAARTARSDPAAAARESEEVRALAESAIARLRASLRTERDVDLGAEVDELSRLLEAAGVRCSTAVEAVDLAPGVAPVLAVVLKEATTNILRHARATRCDIRIGRCEDRVTVEVVNDRPATGSTSRGSGLRGLGQRLAAVGGELTVERGSDSFRIEASVPAGHG